MTDETIKAYYSLSTDIWRFIKSRLEAMKDMADKGAWWDETYRQANEILKKHEPILDEGYIRKKIGAEISEFARLLRA